MCEIDVDDIDNEIDIKRKNGQYLTPRITEYINSQKDLIPILLPAIERWKQLNIILQCLALMKQQDYSGNDALKEMYKTATV